MTKRALVAAVNDYSVWQSGVQVGDATWTAPILHWCLADADAFAQTLRDGFSFDEVSTLKDSDATSSAILASINDILGKSVAGDVFCFYFSGHGGRIPEGPSATATRYYETIIPYDATMISSMDIANIASALPPSEVNFTIVLDSCHSGGMLLSPDARGSIWDQATAQAFQAMCQSVVPWICLSDPAGLACNVSNIVLQGSGVCSIVADTAQDNPENAKATLFSACDYGELSAESPAVGHGYFTKALIEAVNACNFSVSHSDFLASVRQAVAANTSTQTPQLRGRPVRLQEKFLEGWNYST